MESQKAQSETSVAHPGDTSCWKKKAAEGGFRTNFKDHFDEFVSTSVDQHKICLKKTMRDLNEYIKLKKATFGSSKAATDGDSGAKVVESSPPVKATTAQ